MSAFDSGLAIGVMRSFLRLPSRNMKSEVEMNCAGCWASDGHWGLVELPASPWQAVQTAAFFSPSAAPAKTRSGRNKNATAEAAAFVIADICSGRYFA